MKVYGIMSPTLGLQERVPKELLKDAYSPESLNVEICDGIIATRRGLELSTQIPTAASIKKAFVYQPFSGDKVIVLCTNEDIFEYNAAVNSIRYLTPTYSDGTVDIDTLTNAYVVTGTGTLWLSNVKAGDYFGVGTDVDSITDWYRIASVDSDTQITLESPYPVSVTAATYVIRKVFTTEDQDSWRITQFTDSNYGDIIVFTNGRDYPVKYHLADPSVTAIANAPKCKDLVVYKDRLIAIHTEEGGTWQTQRFRWSAVADCETWDATNFQDLIDTKGQLVCGILSDNADYLILFKDDSKYLIRWIGGDYVFDNQRIDLNGTLAPNSVISVPGLGFLYFASDTRIRLYNGVQDVDIGYPIWNTLSHVNIAKVSKIHAFFVSHKKQARFFLPIVEDQLNTTLVYDFENKVWNKWEYKKEITAITEFWNVSTWFWDEEPLASLYWDEWDGYWDSREYLGSAPLTLYCDSNGNLYIADRGLTDGSDVYECYFITKRINFKLPNNNKRLWKIQVWLETTNNSVDISIRGDDSLYWSQTETISLNEEDVDVTKPVIIFDENAENFDIRIKGYPTWRLIGMLFWWSPSYSVV